MTAAEKIAYKNRLKFHCQSTIEQRMAAVQLSIKDAQEAANSEEKSSAGDKYETGRAMGHLQKDMLMRQLAAYSKELSALMAINTNSSYDEVCAGACIETAQETFFIAAGLGKQMFEGRNIVFLSPHAPLALSLLKKTVGFHFQFNGVNVVIGEVY